MKWAERWMARAQRKAALRDERFRRHQDGVRAGTESPGFLDRLESSVVLDPVNSRHFPRYVNADWPLDARPDEASLRLADAWLTWVGHGQVAGPDGNEVRILDPVRPAMTCRSGTPLAIRGGCGAGTLRPRA